LNFNPTLGKTFASYLSESGIRVRTAENIRNQRLFDCLLMLMNFGKKIAKKHTFVGLRNEFSNRKNWKVVWLFRI